MPEPASESRDLLDRLRSLTHDNPKAGPYLDALESTLRQEEARRQEELELLEKYQEAYQKLTSPANRTGVVLRDMGDGKYLIAVGDTEYVCEADPEAEKEGLSAGTRVRVNEAYAIVGVVDALEQGPVFPVAEVLEDGRLRLGKDVPGSDSRLVHRAKVLVETLIQAGDEVRLDGSGRLAVEHFPGRETQDYFFEEVPEVPWEAVGGQEEAIKLIRETIEWPLLHPEVFERYDKKPIKGILMYGPPGCGKTLLGKAVAHNVAKEYSARLGKPVKEYFMAISGPKILNMWLGETERMVREIFATARKKAKEGQLVFIFMDEAESVLRTRSSGRWLNISNTVVPQFCAELDGLVNLENVVLILTSNRPDYIDPAILRPERIDRKVKIARPDKLAAIQILSIYLNERVPLDPSLIAKYGGERECATRELIESAIGALWETSKRTEFLRIHFRSGAAKTLHWKDLVSGAILKSVVDRAKDTAIRREIASGSPSGVTAEDVVQAIRDEYAENEIFPKSDAQEDWLKLLDFEPEDVVAVKPIALRRSEEIIRRSVV